MSKTRKSITAYSKTKIDDVLISYTQVAIGIGNLSMVPPILTKSMNTQIQHNAIAAQRIAVVNGRIHHKCQLI